MEEEEEEEEEFSDTMRGVLIGIFYSSKAYYASTQQTHKAWLRLLLVLLATAAGPTCILHQELLCFSYHHFNCLFLMNV